MIYLVDCKEYQSFEQAAGDREELLLVRRLFDEAIINVNSHTIFNLSKGHSQLMYMRITYHFVADLNITNKIRNSYCF